MNVISSNNFKGVVTIYADGVVLQADSRTSKTLNQQGNLRDSFGLITSPVKIKVLYNKRRSGEPVLLQGKSVMKF